MPDLKISMLNTYKVIWETIHNLKQEQHLWIP